MQGPAFPPNLAIRRETSFGMVHHGHQTDAEASCWSFPAWAGRSLAAVGTAPMSWSGAGQVVNGAAMASG